MYYVLVIWERPLMTSLIFWSFLTYLPTLFYSITSLFWGYFGPPLPTLIRDVINGRSQKFANLVFSSSCRFKPGKIIRFHLTIPLFKHRLIPHRYINYTAKLLHTQLVSLNKMKTIYIVQCRHNKVNTGC